MNKIEIGIHAGILWRALNVSGKSTYDKLKRDTNLNDMELSAALGWLARENKIEFEDDAEGLEIFLPVGFYF